MQLDPDFREFIECCIASGVEFLIVGGYAVAAYGHPRYTRSRRTEIDVEGMTSPVPFIGLDDLRRNKQASGRAQDLADVEALGDQSDL